VLAQILGSKGYGAAAEKADALSISKFFSLDLSAASLICICYVDRPSRAKIHYTVRRLTKKAAGTPVMIAFLGDEAVQTQSLEEAKVVAGPFKEVVEAIDGTVGSLPRPSAPALPEPALSRLA
jgi:hypothetical protein